MSQLKQSLGCVCLSKYGPRNYFISTHVTLFRPDQSHDKLILLLDKHLIFINYKNHFNLKIFDLFPFPIYDRYFFVPCSQQFCHIILSKIQHPIERRIAFPQFCIRNSFFHNYLVQSGSIISKVVSSNSAHGEVYSMQLSVKKFVCDLRQVGSLLRFSPSINLTDLT